MEDIVRILIADDNNVLVDFMKLYIEKDKRYEIIGVSSDSETEIKMIDDLKPDVVITDIRKKNEWTGIDIVRKYKDKEYCPIFFVVSASVFSYMSEIRELKIHYYISKPFNEENFMLRLDSIYNQIYPKEMIKKQKEITKTTNSIIKFFKSLKKRIGI